MKTKFYQQYDLYFISQCKHLIENAEYEKNAIKNKNVNNYFCKTYHIPIVYIYGIRGSANK